MATIGPLIGKGNVAEVHAYGANVLKLFKAGTSPATVLAEASATAIARSHGLDVPAVFSVSQFGERWGLELSRVDGQSLANQAQSGAADPADVVGAMVRVQATIHACRDTRLPSLKLRLREKIEGLAGVDGPREKLLQRLEALPEGNRLCHGDFHPFNLIGPVDRPFIIDWADATCGPSEADICRSYLIMLPEVPALAEAYLEASCVERGLARDSVLAWLGVLAAARISEGIEPLRPVLTQIAQQTTA